MKTLLATIIGLAVAVVANPASAYMIAITTYGPRDRAGVGDR